MKKALMILASVALGAAMASADTTNVESRNIVGMAKANVNPGYWLVGCNFQNMTGGNAVAIADLFPTSELYADPDADADASDNILIFDGVGYTPFFYWNAGNPGDPQWYDQDFNPADKGFFRGDAFWFKRADASSATTLTVLGQVPTDSSYVHTALPIGYYIIGNAYPNQTSLNSLGIDAYADPDANADASDNILVFDGVGYTPYFFWNAGNPGDPQWYDQDFNVTSSGLTVGQGAWYVRAADAPGSATWTEPKMY